MRRPADKKFKSKRRKSHAKYFSERETKAAQILFSCNAQPSARHAHNDCSIGVGTDSAYAIYAISVIFAPDCT